MDAGSRAGDAAAAASAPASACAASFASVDEYIAKLAGTRVIRKVLIANNGIAAVKCIRSIRRWSYETFGNERAVSSRDDGGTSMPAWGPAGRGAGGVGRGWAVSAMAGWVSSHPRVPAARLRAAVAGGWRARVPRNRRMTGWCDVAVDCALATASCHVDHPTPPVRLSSLLLQIAFVVMTTPEDLRANAEYVRMADAFVEVPGGTNNHNFANVRLIVETAEAVGADAVWAGWGHASENPSLPQSLSAAPRPIAFIGPPPGPMHALGDKIGSTIIAQSASVPCIAWNGAGLRVDYKREGLPVDVYAKASLETVEAAVEAAAAVGFPLMIKASEGGGGKGIRKVTAPGDLPAAYRQVASEVPGSPIFIMKLAPRARHLEVQLLADEYGNAVALAGRDCSVQRRHQKIVEEGPVTAAPPPVWAQMEEAAVRLAKEVGYVNAGTVEYLYLESEGEGEEEGATASSSGGAGTSTGSGPSPPFAFLELNPRLQVEHPVTEMITGVDLVEWQLRVASGQKLPLTQEQIAARLRGHALEARVYAENPSK